MRSDKKSAWHGIAASDMRHLLAVRQNPTLEVLEGVEVFVPVSLTEEGKSGEGKRAGGAN
jgi:hypothetical protein